MAHDRARLALALGGAALFGVVMLVLALAAGYYGGACERGHLLPLGKTVVYICDVRRD